MSKAFTIGLIWLFFLSPSTVLGSLTKQEKIQQPPLQHEVSVALKLIQVFVTDKHGKPVKDLEKTDFEVYDAGQLQKITEFEKNFIAAAGKTPEKNRQVDPQKAAAGSVPSAQKLSRKFFFILDVEKNDIQGFSQSKKAAVHFIDSQAQPSDEIAILSYQARRGLVIHEYLSTDRSRLRRTIEKLKGIPGTGLGGLPTEPSEGKDPLGGLFPTYNPQDEEIAMHRRRFVSSLTELAKALRNVPGYKNIVLFSAGFAQLALIEDSGLGHAYEEMSIEFGASSSPVYAVNSLGMRSSTLLPKDRGNETLRDLSELSGGRYFEDVANAEKIATGLQNATGNYYVLGYYLNELWDGRFHEINVNVKREGCVISAQKGYYNPKAFDQLSDFEKELHRMELAFHENPRSQNPIELPLITLPCQDDSGTHIIIMAELPWEQLKDIMQPPTELASEVIDQNNNVIESKSGYIQIPDAAKKKIVYYTIVSLNPGAYNCVITVRNMKTGQGARARGAVMVPQSLTSGLNMSSLLLLVPMMHKDTTYIRLASQYKKADDRAVRTLEEFFPFLSNRLVPVMDEILTGTSRVLGVVRLMDSYFPETIVEFSASIKSIPAGTEILLSPSILKKERRGQISILLIEFPISNVEPGDYTITLVAKDKRSGARTENSRRIRFI